ncbi:protein phosphatase 1 regulatory subunit 12A-like [Protopterus annectens]|uniref:protein phosphatase 1 regulatory subunit 12A-like n=1 Tax=Protopterus annectens TaxID=7888 RepID=UPI001CFB0F28|nr:protein phosphatase 1 regulatory subunit 12A-like [Protopterus annectens]
MLFHVSSYGYRRPPRYLPQDTCSQGLRFFLRFLIKHGASVSAVNSEGELPLDVAQEKLMEKLLQEEIKKQGIDIEEARRMEERMMLKDARQWLNEGTKDALRHSKTGATPLHVAAAKGYVEVMKLLLQAGFDVNATDHDGWTPLHAAAHWGQEEACRKLVEELCNMDAINKVGQTAFDVADEQLESVLEELRKKQKDLRSEKEKRDKVHSAVIDTNSVTLNSAVRTRRSSISRMSSREKISLHDKERKTLEALTLEPLPMEQVNDEEEEARKEDSSSSSSDEEEEASESESEAESEKVKTREMINNLNNKLNSSSFSGTSTTTSPSALTRKNDNIVKTAPKEEEKKEAVPTSWRTSLRKTGSYAGLSSAVAPLEEQKGKDTGIPRSASSPRLTAAEIEDKGGREPRLARVPPTPTQRLFGTQDNSQESTNRDSFQFPRTSSYSRQRIGSETPDTTVAGLSRSSSYTRRLAEMESGRKDTTASPSSDSQGLGSAYQRSNSYLLAVGRSNSSQNLPLRRSDSQLQFPTQSTIKTSIFRSASFGRKVDSTVPTSAASSLPAQNVTSTAASRVNTVNAPSSTLSSNISRSRITEEVKDKANYSTAPTVPSTTSISSSNPTNPETKERRRSYLTPVRDEEAEAQRRAKSRHARQSRRSTQGVTLTDIQEAEKTIKSQQESSSNVQPHVNKDNEKAKTEENKDLLSRYRSNRMNEEGQTEDRWRSRIANLQKSDLLGLTEPTHPTSSIGGSTYSHLGSQQRLDNKELEKAKEEEKDSDEKGSQPRAGSRDHRRRRSNRRPTGLPGITKDSDDYEEEDSQEEEEDESTVRSSSETQRQMSDRLSSRTDLMSNNRILNRGTQNYSRHSNISSISSVTAHSEIDGKTSDFKKMYEDLMKENGRLRDQLQKTQLLTMQAKADLEKAAQRRDNIVGRSSALENEKRERQLLEQRVAELEEELKVLTDLKADNQRLKDENGALIRVISKLSK